MENQIMSMYSGGTMNMNGGGIKCDNPDCDYVDMSVAISDYDKWVNKPCPKCGSNLLTPEDYNAVIKMQALVRIVNDMCEAGECNEDDKKVTMTARFNGTGKVDFEIEK